MKKNLLVEEKQTEDIAPAVKYKNPNAWSRSMPDSICENARYLEARAQLQARFGQKVRLKLKYGLNDKR